MSEKVKVGDIEVNYRVMGEGSPLIMIMGLTANMETWEPGLLEALSRRYEWWCSTTVARA